MRGLQISALNYAIECLELFVKEKGLATCVRRVRCDNNSTDATAAVAETSGCRDVFEPINQISKARNRGASVATGEWLLFVDADSWPSPELIADMLSLVVFRWMFDNFSSHTRSCSESGPTVLEGGWVKIQLVRSAIMVGTPRA